MLCTNCSTELKPIVAVDIDGTLGDYHGHFLRFAVEYLNYPPDARNWQFGYDGLTPFSHWFMNVFKCSLETYRQVKLAYRQGGMKRSMPIFEGAAQICDTIRNGYGAELWVTTTRPYLSLDNIVPDTVEWLRRHGIEYDGMLFDEDKYEQLANRVDKSRVVVVLDDLPEMCRAADKAFGRTVCLLIRGRYNRSVEFNPSSALVGSLPIISRIIQDWHSWTEEMSARV